MLSAGRIKNDAIIPHSDHAAGAQYSQIPLVATASLVAAAAGNEGGIVYDSTSNTLKFSDGSSWANVAASGVTLDTAFDGSNTIDSCLVTDKLTITGGGATFTLWDDTTDIQIASDADIAITATELRLISADVVCGSGAAHADVMSSGNYDLILKTGNSTTGQISITDGANGDILITPNGSGELKLGSGSASAKLSSSGAQDLVLDTNAGTNSGSITITDGANGDIDITPNGTGVVDISNAILVHPVTTTAAGTAALAPTDETHIHHISTDGVDPCAVTLPDASTMVGQQLVFFFDTDGGQDVVVTTAAGDAYYASGDIGDNTATMADAGDLLVIMAVAGNKWIVIEHNGVTLSTV